MAGSNYDRDLSVKEKFVLSKFLVKWEMILVYILILINILLMIMKPDLYFSGGTITSIIQSGMDVSPLVLGMVFILLLGDIDVSVAAEMILAGMVTGLTMDAGLPAFLCVILGLICAIICGAFNGFFVAYMKMPAVIVTISTSMLFRGIVEIILDVNSLSNFPTWYGNIGWDNIAGVLPIAMALFLIMAIIFAIILHKTTFGRKLYIVGNNPTCATYSGISVEHVKMSVFMIMGFMAGIASIFYVGRMGGGLSSSMGTGYEMTAIAICVLGGVSTSGGKGKMYGPIIATFIMAFLTYTLGLMGIDANTRQIFTGCILIVTILISTVNRQMMKDIKLRVVYHDNKNIEATNENTIEAVKEMKKKISELNKSNASDKDAQIQKLNAEIAKRQKECKETTAKLYAEQKANAQQAKERFANK